MIDRAKGGWWIVFLLSVGSLAAPSGDLRLVDAVKNRDREAVRSLLKERVDVNAPEADGATALAWAAHWDDLETADLLIRAGAKVNAPNDYGATPLWLACNNGSAAMVERLLRAGANPNAPLLRTGETPLMTCARSGNVDAVKAMLARGADPNAKESWRGQTALMWAVAEKHSEVARALIGKGADIHARSKSGFTAMLQAAQQGDLESVRILLAAGADVNESTPEDGSVLVVASASGQEALSIFLLDQGANPNAADVRGITALHYAVARGISYIEHEDYTAWRLPPPNMPELAKALLAHGANPNARIAKDFPQHTRSIKPGPISLAGATPFFLASAYVDLNLMRLLLAAGADPKLPAGDTPPLLAAAGLARRAVDATEEESRSALEAVKLLVELGANVNAPNRRGMTAMHVAASLGEDAIVQFLADKGAKLDGKTRSGETPWSFAEGMCPIVNQCGDYVIHKNTADLLLKLGAHTMTFQDFPPVPSSYTSEVDNTGTGKAPESIKPSSVRTQ